VAVVESLKVLDPKWPIREADSSRTSRHVRIVPIPTATLQVTETLPNGRSSIV
jgi:hypothetical protein